MNICETNGEGTPAPSWAKAFLCFRENLWGQNPLLSSRPCQDSPEGLKHSHSLTGDTGSALYSLCSTFTYIHPPAGFLEELCEAAGAHVTIPLRRQGSEIVPGFPKVTALLGGKV